jgi:ribose 5-phosphate isomerase B
MNKKIFIASDHAGFELKNIIIEHLKKKEYLIEDIGPFTEDEVDYPIYAHALSKRVLENQQHIGILICGSGIGMSIAANKHKGVRASVCGDLKSARWTREHNDANVLCMGARIIDAELAKEITDIFLATDFIAGKHKTRVEMLEISQN